MENTHPYSVSYKWTKSDNGIYQNLMTFKSYSDAWDFYTKRVVDLSEHLSLCGGSLDIQLKRDEDLMKSISVTSKSLV
jgi:hypothetical protein